MCGALLASACVGGAGSSDVSAPGFNEGVTSVRNPSTTPGGTLRVLIDQVDSLDPARSYHAGMWNLMRLYTRQLVTYAPVPGDGGTQLTPDLAAGLGRPSEGGRTWTYTLKPGLKFEDGTAVTSSDIKYGIERLFASDRITGGPRWAVNLLDDPKLSYSGPYEDPAPDKLGLGGIVTPDARTIVFRLNQPFADWDYVMALPASSPVPRAMDTGDKYGLRPVSSGPYRIEKADPKALTLVRNPHWSNQTDTVRRALPERVELTVGLDPEERDKRIMDGSADVDITGSGLQPTSIAEVLRDADLKGRADNPTTGNVRMVAMPLTVPPFDNVRCRRAVQYALDKAGVREALGGGYTAALTTTLWPRMLPGYPATDAYPSGKGNAANVEAAKKELEACGKPDGFTTKIATVDRGRGLRTAEVIRDALRDVGIDAELLRFSQETYLVSDAGSQQAVKQAGMGLIVSSWTPDFPAPAAFYVPLTDGRSIRSPGNTNLAELDTDPLKKSVDQANATPQRGTATALWQRYDAAVMQAASYAPIVEDRALLLGSTRLRNVYVHRAYGGYDLTALGVS